MKQETLSAKKTTKYSTSHTSPSMRKTNGLRFKFRSKAQRMNLFQGRFHVQNNFLFVLMTLSVCVSLCLSVSFGPSLPPSPTAFYHLVSDPQMYRSSFDEEKSKEQVQFPSCQSQVIISSVVQVRPRLTPRTGGREMLGYFSPMRGV